MRGLHDVEKPAALVVTNHATGQLGGIHGWLIYFAISSNSSYWLRDYPT